MSRTAGKKVLLFIGGGRVETAHFWADVLFGWPLKLLHIVNTTPHEIVMDTDIVKNAAKLDHEPLCKSAY